MTDEHHAEQSEQITDAEMLDAPEWAWNLADAIVLGNQGCGNAAVLIQRAFAAREAELVDERGHTADAVRDTCRHVLGRVITFDQSERMADEIMGHIASLKATAALKSREASHG